MGLLGRFTTYVGGSQSTAQLAAHNLLSKLFPAGPLATQVANGDEAAAQAIVLAVATSNPGPDPNGGGLQPAKGLQAGDLQMFPQGVDLTFGNAAGSGGTPDVTTVKWKNPGDPANPYIPDITSPPDGWNTGLDKATDPKIAISDVQAESTTEDPTGENLRNPSADAPAVVSNNILGKAQKLGDSGGNV